MFDGLSLDPFTLLEDRLIPRFTDSDWWARSPKRFDTCGLLDELSHASVAMIEDFVIGCSTSTFRAWTARYFPADWARGFAGIATIEMLLERYQKRRDAPATL